MPELVYKFTKQLVDPARLQKELVAVSLGPSRITSISTAGVGPVTVTIEFASDPTSAELVALGFAVGRHFPPFRHVPMESPDGSLWHLTISNLGILITDKKE